MSYPVEIVFGVNSESKNEEVFSLLKTAILPLLPPVIQQRAVADSTVLNNVLHKRFLESKEVDGMGQEDNDFPLVYIHGELVGGNEKLQELVKDSKLAEMLSEGRLWAEAISGDSHQVDQKDMNTHSKQLINRHAAQRVCFSVEYEGKSYEMEVPYLMTGLQLKSIIISHLNLKGGFQHYFLTCGGMPFGSRSTVNTHSDFLNGCRLRLEDVGDRPKPQGRT